MEKIRIVSHKKRRYNSKIPEKNIVIEYYKRYQNSNNRTEKSLIKEELSKKINKSIRQISRYFSMLQQDEKKFQIKRGYGRNSPLNREEFLSFMELIIENVNVNVLIEKCNMSIHKYNRIINVIYIPYKLFINNENIAIELRQKRNIIPKYFIFNINKKDIYEIDKINSDYVEIINDIIIYSICDELKDFFEIFEISKASKNINQIKEYYKEKIKKSLIKNIKIIKNIILEYSINEEKKKKLKMVELENIDLLCDLSKKK